MAGEGQADVMQDILKQRAGRILNVGCGHDGWKIGDLAELAGRLTAADRSDAAVSRAQETTDASNVDFIVTDLHKLPFQDATFDYVVALGVVTYLRRTLHSAAQELRRVLRPNGLLFLTSAVSSPKSETIAAFQQSGFALVEELEGPCLAVTEGPKIRYLCIFKASP